MMPIDQETTWIQTYSGKKFWPLNPRPEDVDILDIAHALSNKCRFTGHCDRFYSVAQHSMGVYKSYITSFKLLPNESDKNALKYVLLHDASEAYMPDVASPIKKHLPGIQDMEDSIFRAICKAVGVDLERIPDSLDQKLALSDLAMLQSEAFWLMPRKAGDWGFSKDTNIIPVIPISAPDAEIHFLNAFKLL